MFKNCSAFAKIEVACVVYLYLCLVEKRVCHVSNVPSRLMDDTVKLVSTVYYACCVCTLHMNMKPYVWAFIVVTTALFEVHDLTFLYDI